MPAARLRSVVLVLWWVQEGGLSVGTVTSLRRVMGSVGAGFGFLACLAWTLVTAKMIVLSAGGLICPELSGQLIYG